MDFYQKEFLTTKPKKEYSDFYNEDIYVIPCRILEIGEEANHNSIWLTIEHLDFKNAEPVKTKAICYKKSLRYISEETLPFYNECSLIKTGDRIRFLVYGRFDPFLDMTHKFLGTYDGMSQDELKVVFQENYKELNAWLKEPTKHY
ncbi:hypothetical protein [Christiangramia crocea]|uniref:Uncharacterized protein n=1 Tax=Christiangramia crocea TaxID=2904124 RepID=A0A9X1UW66_9FLAO|nr:hypothetical protein [Gramella crocea]MCG9971156.1 hypothetical protein [Gramella crocea]